MPPKMRSHRISRAARCRGATRSTVPSLAPVAREQLVAWCDALTAVPAGVRPQSQTALAVRTARRNDCQRRASWIGEPPNRSPSHRCSPPARRFALPGRTPNAERSAIVTPSFTRRLHRARRPLGGRSCGSRCSISRRRRPHSRSTIVRSPSTRAWALNTVTRRRARRARALGSPVWRLLQRRARSSSINSSPPGGRSGVKLTADAAAAARIRRRRSRTFERASRAVLAARRRRQPARRVRRRPRTTITTCCACRRARRSRSRSW